MCPAAAPAAFSPCASVAPAARAAAFLAAPASSTPSGSSERSHTTPARVKTWASAAARASSREAATSAAPSRAISCACAGPPRQAMRWIPTTSPRTTVGGRPSGGTRPLATDTTAARSLRPAACSEAPSSPSSRDGTARKTYSARSTPLLTVLLLVREARRLLGGARLQRRTQAAAREEHRQRRAEGAGPYDDRPARAAAGAPAGVLRAGGRARSRLGLGQA